MLIGGWTRIDHNDVVDSHEIRVGSGTGHHRRIRCRHASHAWAKLHQPAVGNLGAHASIDEWWWANHVVGFLSLLGGALLEQMPSGYW